MIQSIRLGEAEYEECFEFIRDGSGGVDVKKWVAALENVNVQAAAAVVVASIQQSDDKRDGSEHSGFTIKHHAGVPFQQQQQDIHCIPSKDYWMAKCGAEVKRFEWFFIERRRWEDPVDTWLNSKEVSALGQHIGRLFAVPMNQTTKGLMRQWQALKCANDDGSGDIGYEQLLQLLRVCRIRAPEAEVKRIFNAADEDGSGSIDSVEFLSIVRSLQEAGGSSGVEACNFIRALHGPSEALAVVLACTHKSVLKSAGSSSRQECMFHVEIDENETRPCDIRVYCFIL